MELADFRAHVLVVDDDRVHLRLLERLLEKHGYRTSCAANGKEALDVCAEEPPHVIFMDLDMPEMDGLTATRAIRIMDGGSRETLIIAMTASSAPGRREQCFAHGMDHFLEKPISSAQLHEIVSGWPARRPARLATGMPVDLPNTATA